ncbi:hypothetical protein FQN57_004631 [Myotisia sp. PD_48]|nr:hypothetical protein FQN57_004631 [Myotisia sp. PD_48]
MEHSGTSPHFYGYSTNALSTTQQTKTDDRDDCGSPEDVWSGQESGNEGATGEQKASHSQASDRGDGIFTLPSDRAQPSCGWCARNGQLCEYKERKKPGLRAGYGRELEQRLDRLEEVIQAQARLIETHIIQPLPKPGVPSYSSPSERSTVQESSPQTGLYHHGSSAGLSASHRRSSVVANYPPDSQLPSPSIKAFRNGTHQQFPNGMPSHLLTPQPTESSPHEYTRNEAASHNTLSNAQVPSATAQSSQSLADPDADLPPYDLLYSLVDLYFEHINTWCPILHRRTTLDTFFGPSPLKEEDRMLLYAIVATSLRFSTDRRLNEENRKRYHDSSKQKVLLYGIDNSSITALQALVILALDFVGSSNGPPGWKLLALIARSVVQLGLAVESTSSLAANLFPSIYTLRANILPDSKTWIEDEGRRRLFWMTYLLDRYSTIATAFDFALDEKEVDRRLPCKDEFFNKNQPIETRWFESRERSDYLSGRNFMGSFGFYVEVLGILSRIHIFLKCPVDINDVADVEQWQTTYRKLDHELTTWEYHLPAEYSFARSNRYLAPTKSRTVHCGWIMLHAAYQTAVIRLHSSAAYPTTRSLIFTPSYSAIQRCLAAVDRIRIIARFVVDNNVLDKFGPPFAFTLWVSARLLLVNGSTVAHTLDPEISFFVDTLRRMGHHWKVAERYSTILQRVLDEYAEYEQSIGSGSGDRTTPSTVKILADMRRTAFDLDFLISRQPPRGSSNSQAASTNTLGPSTSSPAPPRTLGPHEIEYLDVFGFFNVPRLATVIGNMPQQLDGVGANAQPLHPPAASETPHALPPSIPHATSNASMGIAGGIAIPDLATDVGPPTAVHTTHPLNITDYMIPTPETDWLFRASA